ncbi:HNH endonuclease [Microbispora sp. NPDC049125]|uniref:HNH endonuclease n=1 Tax=Microbispora sp. NPDC049125 TaxID=3154929 RepID=UPI00346521CB
MTVETAQSLPDWRDTRLGTMVRVAIWLTTEVREGNTFTYDQLREAFPNTPQVDRRLRDLRDYEWEIETSRSLPTLAPSEALFARKGIHVWESGKRSYRNKRAKHEVFERDGFSCLLCGLQAAEDTADSLLQFAHVKPRSQGGSDDPENMITVCRSCSQKPGPIGKRKADAEALWELVTDLPLQEQARLLSWIAMNRKPITATERAWVLYRLLNSEQRSEFTTRLGQTIIDRTEPPSGDE